MSEASERVTLANAVGGVQEDSATVKSNMGTNKRDMASIKVSTMPFDSTIDAMPVTTVDIAGYINSMFRGVFRDYEGSTIVFDPQSTRWKATIYLREGGNGTSESLVKNLESLNKKNGDPATRQLESRLQNVSFMCSNVHYKLTPETEEALSKYYLPREKNVKTNMPIWRNYITESQEQAAYGYNGQVHIVCVAGLDVLNILKDIFGWTNDKGHQVDYWLQAIRPITTQFANQVPNMLFTLQRVDCVEVESMVSKIGVVPMVGRLPIIR